MPAEAVVEKDPWLDDEFAQVDFTRHREDLMDDLAEIEQEQQPVPALNPETVTNLPEPEPVAVAPEPEPESEGPEVIELDGGGTLTIEKKGKKWCASLDAGAGGIQNFYGQNKNELLVAAFKAQANATRKIRELNRQVKLGPTTEPKPQQEPISQPRSKQLTADEITEIKLELQTNPDAAFDKWFQKKTGLRVDQLVTLAKSGHEAKTELTAEQVNKEFLARCPDFYPDKNYENFASLVTYLAKHKLGRSVTDRNQDEIYQSLLTGGHWTVQNLETAFNELNEDGLLVEKPRSAPEPTTQPAAQPTPAPAPRSEERIVRTATRPRASLGIRQSEVATVTPPPAPTASVEDYDDMTNEQLLAEIRKASRAARQSPGRR
jgi:hypothetical protein